MPPPRALTPRAAERRRALGRLAIAVALAWPLAARAQGAFDLAQLMRMLAQVKAGEATFVETRTVTMLDRNLMSSGRLRFAAPDTFERETLRPMRESVKVVGNDVTMTLRGRSRTVPLDSVPEAALVMEAIRGTLTGNRDALERHFNASVTGTAQRWGLELVPREVLMRERLVSVRVAGQQALVNEVTVVMADGDRSVMKIEPALPTAAPPVASPSAASAPR